MEETRSSWRRVRRALRRFWHVRRSSALRSEGQALAIALFVTLFVMIAVMATILAVGNDSVSSASADFTTSARLAATSAANWAAAEIERTCQGPAGELGVGVTLSTTSSSPEGCVLQSAHGFGPGSTLANGSWFALPSGSGTTADTAPCSAFAPSGTSGSAGTPPALPVLRQVCVQLSFATANVRVSGAETSTPTGAPEEVTITAVARTDCTSWLPATSGSPATPICATAEVHERIYQQSFVDWLWFDNRTTLDPYLYPTAQTYRDGAGKISTLYGCSSTADQPSVGPGDRPTTAPVTNGLGSPADCVTATTPGQVVQSAAGSALLAQPVTATSGASYMTPLGGSAGGPTFASAATSCNAPASARPEPSYLGSVSGNVPASWTLAPVGSYDYCVPVAFAPYDVVDGPVFTNDVAEFLCGASYNGAPSATFTSPVTTTGPGTGSPLGNAFIANPPGTSSSGGGCSTFGPTGSPPQETTGASPIPFPSDALGVLQTVAASEGAAASGSSAYVVPDGWTVDLVPPTVAGQGGSLALYAPGHASGTPATETLPWPASGVVFGEGSLNVVGTACQPITVSAYEDLNVLAPGDTADGWTVPDDASGGDPTGTGQGGLVTGGASCTTRGGTQSGPNAEAGPIGLIAGDGVALFPPTADAAVAGSAADNPTGTTEYQTTFTGGIDVWAAMVALGEQHTAPLAGPSVATAPGGEATACPWQPGDTSLGQAALEYWGSCFPTSDAAPSAQNAGASATVPNGTHGAADIAPASVFVPGYDAWACGANDSCTLNVNGSIAEYYRGAFGTYDANGHAVTGLASAASINFNQYLLEYQPPYFLRPEGSMWQQGGTVIVNASSP